MTKPTSRSTSKPAAAALPHRLTPAEIASLQQHKRETLERARAYEKRKQEEAQGGSVKFAGRVWPAPKPPFSVDVVDQYEGQNEGGYGPVGGYDQLADAIAAARQITEEAIKTAGSYQSWEGMGDAGLVYDATGKLVWDGVKWGQTLDP